MAKEVKYSIVMGFTLKSKMTHFHGFLFSLLYSKASLTLVPSFCTSCFLSCVIDHICSTIFPFAIQTFPLQSFRIIACVR